MEVALDVSWLADPDCRTIDALARLQLAARHGGHRLVLVAPGAELRELVELCGLAEVLPCVDTDPRSGLQPVGQAEQREPARRVEEERDPADPVP